VTSLGVLQIDVEVIADVTYLVGMSGRSVSGRFIVTDETGAELHTFARVWDEQARETFQYRPTVSGRHRLLLSTNGTISDAKLTVARIYVDRAVPVAFASSGGAR
jgi:hypothetical protein